MPPFRQASFAGGEIAPSLYGRTDLAKYAVGLALCRNFYPTPQGRLVNRAGFVAGLGVAGAHGQALVPVKDETKPVRLLPFVYDDANAYLLEFGFTTGGPPGYCRIYRNVAGVLTLKQDISSPFIASDLPLLKYAQCGDVMTLCAPSCAPQELTRTSDTSWVIQAVVFDAAVPAGFAGGDTGNPYLVEPLAVSDALNVSGVTSGTAPVKAWSHAITEIGRRTNGVVFETAPFLVTEVMSRNGDVQFWNPTTPYGNGTQVAVDYIRGVWTAIGGGSTGVYPPSDGTKWSGPVQMTDRDAAPGSLALRGDNLIPFLNPVWSPANSYLKGATTCMDPLTGAGNPLTGEKWFVALTDLIAGGNPPPINANWLGPFGPQRIQWTLAVAPSVGGYTVIGWNVYRGRDEVYGLVGSVGGNLNYSGSAGYGFTDLGQLPDFTQSPPQGRNPFKVLDGSGNVIRTENPLVVSFFEQRRVFANGWDFTAAVSRRPQWAWLSRVGDFSNFDSRSPPIASDEVEFQIASLQRHEIRSILAKDDAGMLFFTQGGIWTVTGQGGPLGPGNVDAKQRTKFGSAWTDPLLIGDVVLYVRAHGIGVNELVFDLLRGTFGVRDTTVLSRHLFENHAVVDWCYAHDPHQAVWVVRDDGQLLSLTYVREQDVWAWATHTGPVNWVVENVCSLPEGGIDAVYLVAFSSVSNRRLILRMDNRLNVAMAGPTACVFSDIGAPTTTVTQAPGPLTVDLTPWLPNTSVYCVVGGVAYGPKITDGSGRVDMTAEFPSFGSGYVSVGIQHNSDATLLPLASASAEIHVLRKSTNEVDLDTEVLSTGLFVGPDFNNLTGVTLEPAQTFPTSGQILTDIVDSWNQNGQISIRQVHPLPVSITGVTRQTELEEDGG